MTRILQLFTGTEAGAKIRVIPILFSNFEPMTCTLTVVRYPKFLAFAGILSMAFFRVVLWFSPSLTFWKLMGCGKNGTFDKKPDWRQWAVLLVSQNAARTPGFLHRWWTFFRCEKWELTLQPIEGFGTWNRKECFGSLPRQTEYDGMIAVLTRATIRAGKLKRFWQHVDPVAKHMYTAEGFVTSLGIGEMPWIRQATFSVWESKAQMKQFAHKLTDHADVIRKTRNENWYSEEMFVRFRIRNASGTLHGKDPLRGML